MKLKKTIYTLFFLIALIVYILQKLDYRLHFLINNYLNDILSIPLVLKICQKICELIYRKKIQFSIGKIILICIYWSVLFEIIFPQIFYRYTTDFYDIFAYLLGGIIYYIIEKNEDYKMQIM